MLSSMAFGGKEAESSLFIAFVRFLCHVTLFHFVYWFNSDFRFPGLASCRGDSCPWVSLEKYSRIFFN